MCGLDVKRGSDLSEKKRKEAIKLAVTLIEKETVYFTGKKRIHARNKYRALLKLCGKDCLIDEPIYLERFWDSWIIVWGNLILVVKIACKDVDPSISCPFVAQGATIEEATAKLAEHSKTFHNYNSLIGLVLEG